MFEENTGFFEVNSKVYIKRGIKYYQRIFKEVKKLVNQNPEPCVYKESFTNSSNNNVVAVSSESGNIKIEHALNTGEELRLYAIHAKYSNTNVADISMELWIGNNKIPSEAIDLDFIASRDDLTYYFACPILVLSSQILQINVINDNATYTGSLVLSLTGEKRVIPAKQ